MSAKILPGQIGYSSQPLEHSKDSITRTSGSTTKGTAVKAITHGFFIVMCTKGKMEECLGTIPHDRAKVEKSALPRHYMHIKTGAKSITSLQKQRPNVNYVCRQTLNVRCI